MNGKSYTVYEESYRRWIVETKDGDKVERSEHTSKKKALIALLFRLVGIKLFYVTIPNNPNEGEK